MGHELEPRVAVPLYLSPKRHLWAYSCSSSGISCVFKLKIYSHSLLSWVPIPPDAGKKNMQRLVSLCGDNHFSDLQSSFFWWLGFYLFYIFKNLIKFETDRLLYLQASGMGIFRNRLWFPATGNNSLLALARIGGVW